MLSFFRKFKRWFIGLFVATAFAGGVDLVNLEENKLILSETVKGERVKVEQVENVVSATLPWKGEQGIKVTYDLGEPTFIEKISDKRKKNIVTEKVPIVGGEGFKIDITLDEKPTTNMFCYFLEGWEQYDFFYQPPLTEQEIAEGAYRPPEIVGSYAVYHKTLKNHKIGGVNYETGKAFHIPFPYVWEIGKESEKQRADNLTFDRGNLCVTVPQKFLDEANYPIRIDPTFGYSTAGATDIIFPNTNTKSTSLFTLTENGDISKLTVVFNDSNASHVGGVLKGVIYDKSGVNPNALKGTTAEYTQVDNNLIEYEDITFSSTVSLTSGDYFLGLISDAVKIGRADTLGNNKFNSDTYSDGPSDPFGTASSSTFQKTIYATYTTSGSATSTVSSEAVLLFE